MEQQDEPVLSAEDKSVYDFHEGSDRDEDGMQLSIDDSPRKPKKQSSTVTTGSLKMRIPGGPVAGTAELCLNQSFAAAWAKKSRQDADAQAASLPKNGIESLLKASALTNKLIE